ncbi:DNA primase [Aliishimia ponticola]|uniref:DNA primase n=1 Tax=Aliishimia ponticola TaxID=2499833 RepID=A0A4S4N960_9RHOB|nr:DNA primase [Aliishimia ponticola]THH35689.1 DNA primase [Aliishimia ponticola]
MSLPPGFLDELRTRLSLSQVVGRKVMWDSRKSNPGKGDMWSPCPFHQEKTASFHVDDRKGFYYCFGCHAKGDAIKFVCETENVSFMEAVEILATEAGLQMPARDPRAQEKADRRTQLSEVMDMAVRHFRMLLRSGAGAQARDYLARRGLDEAAQDRWEIGFAPDTWQGLWGHLKEKGVEDDLILAAGLAKNSSKGGKPYDTFRGRIMFPIRDARGRCTAFGGRAMDPNDPAKYLNSPETELFDKGRSLYNHGPAREAAGKGNTLLVAEGYMDVIALSEAGFKAAVAPLGTAVTEHQLAMMWRIADEPIIALDGDTAGLRAAMRVIDIALPMLEAGKSLRFAMMPEGQDPDDLLRAKGAPAVQAILDAAMPMVELLWRRETEGKVFDSPERKAALDKALREKITLIKDPSVRQHYGTAIKELRWQLFRPARPGGQGGGRPRRDWKAPPPAQPSTRASMLATGPEDVTSHLREAVILGVILKCPELAPEFESGLESLQCRSEGQQPIRDAILRHIEAGEALMSQVEQAVGPERLESFFAQSHLAVVPCIRTPGDPENARMTVVEELAKLQAIRGLEAEIAEAAEDVASEEAEALTWRLRQAADAMARAQMAAHEDRAEYDVGNNGAAINREERSNLDSLLETIRFTKERR